MAGRAWGGGAGGEGSPLIRRACASKCHHRWNRNPRPQPEKLSKLVSLITCRPTSGTLVGVGGSGVIGCVTPRRIASNAVLPYNNSDNDDNDNDNNNNDNHT